MLLYYAQFKDSSSLQAEFHAHLAPDQSLECLGSVEHEGFLFLVPLCGGTHLLLSHKVRLSWRFEST